MPIDNNADFMPDIPDSEITPVKYPYKKTGSFRFWAQKVLPTVYDDSLSYYEVLTKIANYLNDVIQNVDSLNGSIDSVDTSFNELQTYVNTIKDQIINTYNILEGYINTYFDDLDVQDEINNKLDELVDDGVLEQLVYAEPYLFAPYLDGSYEPCGNCFVFIYKRNCTIIDLGNYGAFDGIKEQLDKLDVRAIDNIIITHWHNDHDGFMPGYNGDISNAYDHWKESFDMSNTVFYIPRNTPNGFNGSGGYYAITASFPDNEINILSNDTSFEWRNITFSVKNQGDDDYSHYSTLGSSDLNHCSALVYAKYKNIVFLDTSDVTSAAQEWCVTQGYVESADISTVPHHGVNGSAYAGFMETIKPLYTILSDSNTGLKYGLQDPTIGSLSTYSIIFENVINDKGVIFGLSTGVSVAGSPTATTGRGTQGKRTIYVDASVEENEYQNGSLLHPYKSITTACGHLKGYTEIILLSDITSTSYITGAQGVVVISGNNHQIGGVNINDGAWVNINHCKTYSSYGIYSTDSTLFISDCIITSPMNIQRSTVNAFRINLLNSDFIRDCFDSKITMAEISGTASAYIISNALRNTIFITGNTTGAGIHGTYNDIIDRATAIDPIRDPFHPSNVAVDNADNAPYGVVYVGDITNIPEPYAILFTIGVGNYKQQIAFPMGGIPTTFYVRKNSGSAWTAWKSVVFAT